MDNEELETEELLEQNEEIDEEEPSEGESTDESLEDESDDEVVITLGDEEETDKEVEKAPSWVRELRKSHREMKRENRELRDRLNQTNNKEKKPEIRKKPTLDDHDYDADSFERDLESWYEEKRAREQEIEAAKSAEESQKRAWQERIDRYNEAKKSLNIKNYDELEENVVSEFDETQQGIIVHGANEPEKVIAAIGGNQKILSDLSKIKDPVKFAVEIGRLESKMKVSSKKKITVPPPEKRLSGTGKASGSVDSTLDRLREDAERTGDYTKVIQYKRSKRK